MHFIIFGVLLILWKCSTVDFRGMFLQVSCGENRNKKYSRVGETILLAQYNTLAVVTLCKLAMMKICRIFYVWDLELRSCVSKIYTRHIKEPHGSVEGLPVSAFIFSTLASDIAIKVLKRTLNFNQLIELCDCYRYKRPDERNVLDAAMQHMLPLIYQRCNQLLPDLSETSTLLQKQILKIYYAFIQVIASRNDLVVTQLWLSFFIIQLVLLTKVTWWSSWLYFSLWHFR